MTTIVILYSHKHARGNELRWLLRSLVNLKGEWELLVVGDPPPWYVGPSLRMEQEGTHWEDVNRKYKAICDNPNVSEDFIVVMDDTVFVKKIDLERLKTPLYEQRSKYKEAPKGSHHGARRIQTILELRRRGYTEYDTATHWPYFYNKKKLMELLSTWPDTSLFEVVYANVYGPTPIRQTKELFIRDTANTQFGKSVVYNYRTVTRGLELELLATWPYASPYEQETGEFTLDCRYRGKVIGEVTIDICGPNKGQILEINNCDYYNRPCTLRPYANTQKELRCITCKARTHFG